MTAMDQVTKKNKLPAVKNIEIFISTLNSVFLTVTMYSVVVILSKGYHLFVIKLKQILIKFGFTNSTLTECILKII